MVLVKDSTKWVRDNYSNSAPTKKRDRKGDTSSPVSFFSSSPVLSTKKRSYDTAMAPPEEEVNGKSTREYRPLPKQAEVEPPAKPQRHVTFTSLPNNMFYAKLQRAEHPISFFDPLKSQKTPASSSRSVSQPSASSSAHARSSSRSVSQPSTSTSGQARVSGKRAGPGKDSKRSVPN